MPFVDKIKKAEYQKKYYLKNRERLQQYRKKCWLELKNDPEKWKIYQQKRQLWAKGYREKNRQKLLDKHKKYYQEGGNILAKKRYNKIMNDPLLHKEHKAKRRLLQKKRMKKIYKDPILHEQYKEKIRIQQRKRHLKNKDEINLKQRIWRRTKMKPSTKEKILKNQREWDRKQKATNPAYKIKYNIKSRLGLLLKKQKITKRERTVDYIGCSFEEFKNHLEKQFQPGMSWENRTEWHIDHIIPVNYFVKNFDFSDINVQKKCWHYTNLRPLWKFDNLSKGTKIL
tara:strand:- start:96 stop:947 length:852 start_codon:yes stop_codon:yes gene_type:complete